MSVSGRTIHGLKYGTACNITVALEATSGGAIQTTPTIATGDFKLSKDGGPLADLGSNPAEAPAGSGLVVIALTATEMQAARVVVRWIDQAGGEWQPGYIEILTTAVTVDELVRSTTPANTLDVASTGEAGCDLSNVKQPATLTVLDKIGVQSVAVADLVSEVDDGAIDADSFAAGAISATAFADLAAAKVWLSLTDEEEPYGTLIARVAAALETGITDGFSNSPDRLYDWLMALAASSALTPAALSLKGWSPTRDSLQGIAGRTEDIDYPGTGLAAVLATVQSKVAGLAVALYSADVDYVVDEAGSRDEYTVAWFKNGMLQTSGITSPVISVYRRSDGAAIIAAQAMTAIGSTGAFKYDATGGGRQLPGDSVIIDVSATIDGATRTWRRLSGRDSAA